jgi:hypothetical protein
VSTNLKKACFRLHDVFSYFIDSSESEDVVSVTSKEGCRRHYQYYVCRLQVLQKTLLEVREEGNLSNTQLQAGIELIADKVVEITAVGQVKGCVIWKKELELIPMLNESNELINRILPRTKSILLEWTDAGPGVGITQKVVKFRAAQIARVLDLDYLIRLHLANDDSCHNEVERCQSYVGDAIL